MRFVETPVFTKRVKALLQDDMLFAYSKSVQEDFTPDQLRVLARIVREEFR